MKPVALNIRGTSGSGKSTLIRALFEKLTNVEKVFAPADAKRKQPLGYTGDYVNDKGETQKVFIAGHYESACGGCDTLGKYLPNIVEPRIIDGEEPNSYHLTFGLVREYLRRGLNVVFEGLLISGDVRHTRTLHEDGLAVSVLAFDIPVELCIQSVLARRAAAGNDKPLNEANTRDKHRLLANCIKKLDAAGVPVITGDRDQTKAALFALLGFPIHR